MTILPPAELTNNQLPTSLPALFRALVSTRYDLIAYAGNVSYVWEFGDGGSGTGLAVSHSYVRAGEYSVLFTASNQVGMVTGSLDITVLEGLCISIGLRPTVKPGYSSHPLRQEDLAVIGRWPEYTRWPDL